MTKEWIRTAFQILKIINSNINNKKQNGIQIMIKTLILIRVALIATHQIFMIMNKIIIQRVAVHNIEISIILNMKKLQQNTNIKSLFG